jgi:DNA-binding ferritin-like protein
MRRQSGTSALKTLLYMDEIFGFFPPTKNPPSKEPMLLLLKQARAYGIGIILSTQNPVDLDYKGLSNIGTWFIGRLQTPQDIDRVIDGLEGKDDSNFNRAEIKNILSHLQKRTFFLKSAHLDDIRLFTTRWVLSYLKGPLKRDEISVLMKEQKEAQDIEKLSVDTLLRNSQDFESIQNIDASIPQYFEPDISGLNEFYPTLMSRATVHFYNQSRGIDEEKVLTLSLELDAKQQYVRWEDAVEEDFNYEKLPSKAATNAKFQPLPEVVLEDKGLKRSIRELKTYLYQEEHIELFRCKSPKIESKVGESSADFTVRVQDRLNDKKEQEIEKLKTRYASKEKVLTNRLMRANDQVEKESSDSTSSMIDAGIAVIGALFGRKTPTKIGRAFKKSSDIFKERGDISKAEERVVKVEDDIETLENELEDKIDQMNDKYSIDHCEIETFSIKPRKSDIDVESCAVVWRV